MTQLAVPDLAAANAAGHKENYFVESTEIFEAYLEFLQPARYKVAYGGRGSAKTRTFCTILLNNVLYSGWRLACFRELMKSLADSVYQEFIDEIERKGVGQFFKTIKNSIKCLHFGGGIINFDGLFRNEQKVKGYANYDAFWIEEAENVSADSWKYLIPTLRREKVVIDTDGLQTVISSEIWVSYNPDDPLGATHMMFVTDNKTAPDYVPVRVNGVPILKADGTPKMRRYAIIRKVNYTENPRFPETLRIDMELMKESDFEMYRHVYLGEPVGNSDLAIIKPVWIEAAIDAHTKLGIVASGGRMAGFDVADEGPDKNAFLWRHGVVLIGCEEWRDQDPNSAARAVFTNALNMQLDSVTYDNIGVGAGAKGAIREEKAKLSNKVKCPQYRGFVANAEVLNPEQEYKPGKKNVDMFLNLKAQAWWVVADRFKNTYDALQGKPFDKHNLVSIDRNVNNLHKLCAELAQPRREFQNGKFKVESKKDMRKRGVVSPNLADGFVMAYAPEGGFKLESLI